MEGLVLPEPPPWLRRVPLAHQGLHGGDVVENTLPAFAAAAAAGTGVELDVHRSRDGVPVVFHDPDLADMADRAARVADLTADELSAVRLCGGDHGIPRLAEVLAVLGDAPVMVEIKNPTGRATLLDPAVAALLAEHPGPACVSSFNPRTLQWFRRHAPEIPRVLTAGPMSDAPIPGLLRWSLRTLRWLPLVRPCAICYDLAGIDDPAVQAYRETGGTVVTWTIRTADELARARRLADNVVFEQLPVASVT